MNCLVNKSTCTWELSMACTTPLSNGSNMLIHRVNYFVGNYGRLVTQLRLTMLKSKNLLTMKLLSCQKHSFLWTQWPRQSVLLSTKRSLLRHLHLSCPWNRQCQRSRSAPGGRPCNYPFVPTTTTPDSLWDWSENLRASCQGHTRYPQQLATRSRLYETFATHLLICKDTLGVADPVNLGLSIGACSTFKRTKINALQKSYQRAAQRRYKNGIIVNYSLY